MKYRVFVLVIDVKHYFTMAQIWHVCYQHLFFSTGFMPLKCGYSSNVNYNVNDFNGQLCIKGTIKDRVSLWQCY